MDSSQIRELFLRFFEGKGHRVLPSSPLVPYGDPTLLFTTAGMVQFKPYFLGQAPPPHPRLATCQKCFRATDINFTGDTKHLTFFEMLGNFSIGNYFKKEAIAWAWEFITQHLNLPPERLWITIFLDDEEAFGYWRQVGMPEARIKRFDEKDNFWGPAGEYGPCGPCSEIHYDFGEEWGCGKPTCGLNCDCPRFLEIWNLVFVQYNQDAQGKRTPLPNPSIDTGMGLERITAVMQGQASLYDTDMFQPIVDRIGQLANYKYGTDQAKDRAVRIVAEHGRGLAFLLADGIFPSNKGRGYVLRRLLRRAQLFGHKLGLVQPFLSSVAEVVIDRMGEVYPELKQSRTTILKLIEMEEGRFQRTLARGLDIVEGYIAGLKTVSAEDVARVRRVLAPALEAKSGKEVRLSSQVGQILFDLQERVIEARRKTEEKFGDYEDKYDLACSEIIQALHRLQDVPYVGTIWAAPGERLPDPSVVQPQKVKREFAAFERAVKTLDGPMVFELYDTYGFPVELTEEIAKEKELSLDMAGFEAEMERQRERARAAQKFRLGEKPEEVYKGLNLPATPFVGYETTSYATQIVAILSGGQPVERASAGQEVEIVLAETPFYAEMGGQVGDTGVVWSPQGRATVTNTWRPLPDLVVHRGQIEQGELAVGDGVMAEVGEERRLDIGRNHTATHLLQAALRKVLGEHVFQRGSLVAPDHLRFDFSHAEPLSKEQTDQIQGLVNDMIRRNYPVLAQVLPYKVAVEKGAIALFGEKYGEEVRMVEVRGVSRELCGGTHLKATGEIGFFLITSESSIGAGLRRIEAVTGRGAEALVRERLATLEAAARKLQGAPETVETRVVLLQEELTGTLKQKLALERELMKVTAQDFLQKVESVNGVSFLSARVEVNRLEALGEMADLLRDRLKSGIIVLGTLYQDRPHFLAVVTKDMVAKGYHAGNIVRKVAQEAGGGGGGRPEFAQAGGRDKSKLDQALKAAKDALL